MNSRKGKAYYTSRDAILYAFGIGCTPDESSEMKYIYEHDAQFTAFATFPLTLPFRATVSPHDDASTLFDMPSFPPPFMKAPDFISNQSSPTSGKSGAVIHLSQKFRLHKPIPISTTSGIPASVDIVTDVLSMIPHKRGSIVITETRYYTQDDLLATSQATTLYPNKINSPQKNALTSSSLLQPIAVPSSFLPSIKSKQPPTKKRYLIHNNQALLYRLSGDTNQIHVVGSPLFHSTKPILHGLCTLGYAVRAVLTLVGIGSECRYVECKFTKPVFVGDEIEVNMWECDELKYDRAGQPTDERVIVFEVRKVNDNSVLVDQGVALSSGVQQDSLNAKL